jgi:hypothetical protein
VGLEGEMYAVFMEHSVFDILIPWAWSLSLHITL